MSPRNVITVEKLSKRYLLGHQSRDVGRSNYTALRDVMVREARNFARKAVDIGRGRQIVQGDEIEEFWALKDVNFEVKEGTAVAIIGRNGAGKSTLLKILGRITEPSDGRVELRGRVASLLEVGTGFHPELTGRENIFLNGAVLGMTQREIRRKFDEIVAFAEVERFLDTPVKHFSSGMYMRLAFAVAAHLEPEIIVVDEVLAVGDADFQKKCLGRMDDITRRQGRTVLFVTHNMAAARALCSQGLLLERGRLLFVGPIDNCIQHYNVTRDNSGSNEWIRPPEKAIGKLGFKRIAIQLLGAQPDLVLRIVCSFAGEPTHKPATAAFDIADTLGAVLMQALPSVEPFIMVGSSEEQFCCDVHLPGLVPGRYSVTCWVGPHNTETYDLCRECLSFEITESPTPARTFPHAPDHGFLAPKCSMRAIPQCPAVPGRLRQDA
jgi:lipopolysaccharide transport system ATP-binding protein